MQNMQLIFHSAFVVPNSSMRVLSQLVVIVVVAGRETKLIATVCGKFIRHLVASVAVSLAA